MGWIKKLFRYFYEKQVNIQRGVLNFIGNVIFIQLKPDEYVELKTPSPHLGDITVTARDMRPMLTYKYWPKKAEWSENLPVVKIIVEEKRFLIEDKPGEWNVTDLKDPRIMHLRDMFMAWVFYSPLSEGHKRILQK